MKIQIGTHILDIISRPRFIVHYYNPAYRFAAIGEKGTTYTLGVCPASRIWWLSWRSKGGRRYYRKGRNFKQFAHLFDSLNH